MADKKNVKKTYSEKKQTPGKKTYLKIIFIVFLVLILLVVVVAAIRKEGKAEEGSSTQKEADTPEEKWQEGTIRYDGRSYEYNHNIKTYLFLGIDKDEKVSKAADGISGGQSDALFLLVEDSDKKELSVIAINRNTMAMLDIYDREGDYLGQEEGQICLQHGYGDGMRTSCSRSAEAVSRLFYNLPINGYLSLNMGAIPGLNDAVGGVEVEVMQSLKDEQRGVDLKEGELKTLNGQEAYVYLRSRDLNEFDSSSLRLERQKQYLLQFFQKAKQEVAKDASVGTAIYSAMEDYMVTNIETADLITEISEYHLDGEQVYTVPGETVMGEQFEEFYPDEDAFYKMIIDIFYQPVEET